MATSDAPQTAAELVFVSGAGARGTALGRALLATQLTGPSFGDPETFLQDHHGPAASLRG
jgi:hypothetical protein